YERATFTGNNAIKMLGGRLRVESDVFYSQSVNRTASDSYFPVFPYEELVDKEGMPAEVSRLNGLSAAYTDTAGSGLLLDWKYRPMDELKNGHIRGRVKRHNFILGSNIGFKIFDDLRLDGYYQYNRNITESSTLFDENSFHVRNLVNYYSQTNQSDRTVFRPIPVGAMLNSSETDRQGHSFRLQANYDNRFERHHFTAIGGYEIRGNKSVYANPGTYYGYNEENETFHTVLDLVNMYPLYYGGGSARISNNASRSTVFDRNISYYANVGYSWGGLYLLSASYRKDQSNIFGVKTNQRGVPLWSVGAGWNISKEASYQWDWLPQFKVRATYGYNGNVDKGTSAYLTARILNRVNLWYDPYVEIVNPPNPSLRWEKVENMNIGVDFAIKGGFLSGSFEYYVKNGRDLMGESPLAPQTGNAQFYGNVANTHARGIDVRLAGRLFNTQPLNWQPNLIINANKDIVMNYKIPPGANRDLIFPISGIFPLEGDPINAIVSYPYAGLSSEGNPRGYLAGEVSESYTEIMSSTRREDIIIHGSRTPRLYGAFRNTLIYNSFEFSFNIVYKLDYYFRRQSFKSNALIGAGTWRYIGDYRDRWQQPGDENKTNVPKLLYPFNVNRDLFYEGSSYLVENGSHIRFQDLQASYTYRPKLARKAGTAFQEVKCYLYMSNFGVIWRANKQGLDPSALTGAPAPFSASIGLQAKF
ncbi:MAG TPA: TonB-dependent receptor, partial [Parapedobacter sp.]|nr:TonB-dependent receptor [Parapedobacter sp.]